MYSSASGRVGDSEAGGEDEVWGTSDLISIYSDQWSVIFRIRDQHLFWSVINLYSDQWSVFIWRILIILQNFDQNSDKNSNHWSFDLKNSDHLSSDLKNSDQNFRPATYIYIYDTKECENFDISNIDVKSDLDWIKKGTRKNVILKLKIHQCCK